MSELLQRFRERYEIWREEREGGPAGPPSGQKPRRRNPLLWGLIAAIASLLPPYHFRSFVDLLLPTAAAVFIIFYFMRSYFAWHVLAVDIFVITPVFVLLSPSWRLQLHPHPQIIWFPIVGTCIFGALVIWGRKRYFAYLEQPRASSTERI
jgi:hypothetical protein